MPLPVIQPSFAAGEISPQLFAHIDLAKLHIGAALMRNFIVDYRGGASNRQGTKFVARAKDSVNPVRLIPFTFNVLQAYELEFGHNYMRVIMNGSPVLEPAKVITAITQANPGVLTSNGHGFLNGDTVFITGVGGMTQLNGRTFLVAGVTANTFTLTDLDGVAINTTVYGAFTAGGAVARVFTLNTPYAGADLALLKFAQNADVMTLTHPSYKIQLLTRTQHYEWSIVPLTFNPVISTPQAPTCVNNPAASTTTYRYVVTALSPDFKQESLPSAPASTAVALVMSTNANSFNTVGCAAVLGAGGYNFYRQIEVPGSAPSVGSVYGFVGTSLTNSFVDHNINPNFSLTPPQGNDPFSRGSIVSVPVTAGGAAYLPVPDTIITATDVTGTGAALVPVIAGGVITGVNVTNGGNNYTAPTFAASTTIGTGADIILVVPVAGGPVTSLIINNGGRGYASNITGTAVNAPGFTCTFVVNQNGTIINFVITAGGVGNHLPPWPNQPVTIAQAQVGAGAIFGAAALSNVGNNPGCVTYFQQRQIFGGSNPKPQDLWMSRSNDYFNMNFSAPAKDDDAVFTTLVSREVNAIKWLISLNSLIVLTGKNAWRVDGGSQSDTITPTKINAVPQSFNGAADVPPLTINYDILYVQNKGSVVRDLSYNFYANIYTGSDLTVLANHLVKGRKIVEWAWAEEPQKVIWCVRDDGVLLSLTYLKEQDVYGWAKHDTLGAFQSVSSITEGQDDAVYFVVLRLIGGKYVKYIERLASRNFEDDVTGAWFVDCGLSFPLTFLAATATPSAGWKDAGLQTITISTDVAVFTAPMVGNQIRMNGGVGLITAFTDVQHVTVKMSHPMNNVFPALPNFWSCTAPVASVGGLWHLIGMSVTGLVDGSVMTPRVVAADGTIALDQSSFPSVVGLGYQGQLQSLYANDGGQITIQGRRKNIPAVTARVHNSRGVKCGPNFENMYEFKERTEIPYLLPAPVGQADQTRISISTNLGDAVPLQTADERVNIDSDWTVPGQVCFQQDYPLPTTITGIIPDIDVGDPPSVSA